MIISILGLLVGLGVGFLVPYEIPAGSTTYVAVCILACIDSILGGMKSYLRQHFDINIFLSGFLGNTAIAMALTYAGDRIGLSLYLAAIVVYGGRIFNNFAHIRRLLLKDFNITL